MIKFASRIAALALATALMGCAATAQSVATEPPVALPAKAVAASSGDALGMAVTTLRDASAATGGASGFVNAAHYVRTITGANETALEWPQLVVLDNHSKVSDGNTANYAQANKHSTGATFAGVSEASDTTGLPGALVAHEFDSWVTGPDNGLRIGLEIVNGDALMIRGLGVSAQAESTAAIRIGQTISTPRAAWTDGLVITGNILNNAIKIVNPAGVVVFEIKPNGDIYRRGVLLP
jgi:hypothetical protein